jgi:hypothetical protein
LRRADPRSRSLTVCVKKYIKIEEEGRAQQWAVEPLMNELRFVSYVTYTAYLHEHNSIHENMGITEEPT